MTDGKSIHEIHLGYVELLKARGEKVVQPRGKPMGHIKGYDKTIGLISAGTIAVYKQGGYTSDLVNFGVGSTFDILQDMLTHAYTGVRGKNLGLCDAKCWYEAIEDKRIREANKEHAEKQAVDLPRAELIPLLKQEYVIEILSGIIEVIQQEKESDFQDTWKQDFLRELEIPIEFKKILGYEEE